MKKAAILLLGALAGLGTMAAAQAGSIDSFASAAGVSPDCGGNNGKKGPPSPPPVWDAYGGRGITCAPVPEPATWAMMIAGVGLLGAFQLRRRGAKPADRMSGDGTLA
jgi:PEP-CTERM motif